MNIDIKNLEDLPRAAGEFLGAIGDARVVAFDAGMGVGKTTFITALCRALGVEDDVASPTFAIVNEYSGRDGQPIYHFDCYRLEDVEEARDFGAEDYLDSGHLCLIEWPDIIEPLLPYDTLRVAITENQDGSRTIKF